ncbi:hypothetical protein [Ligilactobacillus cholophilus]|uniref:hypothetical protein n=1 Tax=Ligilactobacillus cholophilus TaxID=3050131 RepID=UPI0025B00FD0|nr:hypothetical protein [Ligilactobacillus cholophilus]
MIYSSERQLAISGWLKENDQSSFNISLKLQKFLFFYESMSKVDGDDYDFRKLRGYKNGPVFSNVWGDYTKERPSFDQKCDEVYTSKKDIVCVNRAKTVDFFIQTCTEHELSEISHTMNIWKNKKERINSNEYQVDLDENDFSSEDTILIKNIEQLYPPEMIDKNKVIRCGDKIFILSNEDYTKINPEQMDTLMELSNDSTLENPVYVDIDEGVLLID